jgi:hypothetical protein
MRPAGGRDAAGRLIPSKEATMDQHNIKVRLTASFRGSPAGETMVVTPALAEHLERQGIAEAAPAVTSQPQAHRPAVERAVRPAAVETR